MKEIAEGAIASAGRAISHFPFPALAEIPETMLKVAAAPMAVYNPLVQRFLGRGGVSAFTVRRRKSFWV